MIYGDIFSISKKKSKWLKVKIKEENYKGYIQNKKFSKHLKHTNKINKQKQELNLSRSLKKEVTTGAHGTQDYVIKKGVNSGKIADKGQ